MSYKVVPIRQGIANEVRETLISPQYKSLKAAMSVADGYGPCRSCLRVFEQGSDRRIYFTYNVFEGLSALPDPGPIFIHENHCEPFGGDNFPLDILELPVLLEAFADESRLVIRATMEKRSVNEQIARIFRGWRGSVH